MQLTHLSFLCFSPSLVVGSLPTFRQQIFAASLSLLPLVCVLLVAIKQSHRNRGQLSKAGGGRRRGSSGCRWCASSGGGLTDQWQRRRCWSLHTRLLRLVQQPPRRPSWCWWATRRLQLHGRLELDRAPGKLPH